MATDKIHSTVRQLLLERAQSRTEPEPTITYGDLVNRVGLPPITNAGWDNHPLSKILGWLNEDDHKANRPWLSTLVVNAKDHISGPKFFEALSTIRYGGIAIPKDRQLDYWYLERDLLIKYWRKHPG